jgi:hypothetical protein
LNFNGIFLYYYKLAVLFPEFPDSQPVMIVMNTSYREGELLTVNCTSQASKSPPTLTFYINNHAVSISRA